MNCPNCNYDRVPEGARFCPNCSAALVEAPQPSTQITVTQDVESVEGGHVTGVNVSQVLGDLVVNLRDRRATQEQQFKERLLERVKTSWIEGVLEKVEAVHAQFIQDGRLIELHKRVVADAVDYTSDAADEVSHLKAEAYELSPDKSIAEIFDDIDRSLLILGNPGSGKTIALLELARDAIARAEEDPNQPVPIVLNLSSWNDNRLSIEDWVVYELTTQKYGVGKDLAREWLANDELLLLLDGLDEVTHHYRDDCIQAINQFVARHGLIGIAVCCRREEYMTLKDRLNLHGAILLEALTEAQIATYFEAAGPSLAGLRVALEQDAPLRKLVETPLMLSIMSLTYQDVPASALAVEGLDSAQDRRRHLFDAYIERMFRYKGAKDKPYTDEQTKGWLSWLARHLEDHNQSTFLIEHLQPSWLPSSRWQWAYMVASRLWVALIGGLIGGAIIGLGTAATFRLGDDLIRGWLIPGLRLGLTQGLTGGLIAALVTGLVDMIWILHIGNHKLLRRMSPYWKSAIKIFISSLIVSPTVAILFVLIFGTKALAAGLSVGLIFGLSSGLLFGFGPRGARQSLTNDIQTVEQISWLRQGALQGGLVGITAGAIAGAIAGIVAHGMPLLYPLEAKGLSTGEIVLAMTGISSLYLGLLGLVFGGLGGTFVKAKKLTPNQGLRLSLVNACVIAPLIGMVFGLVAVAIGWILDGPATIVTFALYGLFIGVLAGLWYGGIFLLQHGTLRLLLWSRRDIPRLGRFAHFLDYAARRVFLQKVGGGYIFIHRYLQEHFAAMRFLLEETS